MFDEALRVIIIPYHQPETEDHAWVGNLPPRKENQTELAWKSCFMILFRVKTDDTDRPEEVRQVLAKILEFIWWVSRQRNPNLCCPSKHLSIRMRETPHLPCVHAHIYCRNGSETWYKRYIKSAPCLICWWYRNFNQKLNDGLHQKEMGACSWASRLETSPRLDLLSRHNLCT